MRKPVILVINPIASGAYLVTRLAELGYDIVNFGTVEMISDYHKDVNAFPFLEVIKTSHLLEDDVARLRGVVEKYGIRVGLIGAEVMYAYAEAVLASVFPEASNDPATSAARYSKYAMQHILQKANLPFIDQCILSYKTENMDTLIDCARDFYQKHAGRVILKPESESAGAYGLLIPTAFSDVETYVRAKPASLFGEAAILMEQRISGEEYYIDAVSMQGRHVIVNIGVARKAPVEGTMQNVYKQCLDARSERYQQLVTYATSVLTLLGVTHGLSHVEVFLDEQGRLYLIELNPRIAGAMGMLSLLSRRHVGYDQIDYFIRLAEGGVCTQTIPSLPVKVNRMVYLFHLSHEGYQQFLMLSKKLYSYYSHKVNKLEDKRERLTQLADVSVLVLLSHDSITVIDEETAMIHALGA